MRWPWRRRPARGEFDGLVEATVALEAAWVLLGRPELPKARKRRRKPHERRPLWRRDWDEAQWERDHPEYGPPGPPICAHVDLRVGREDCQQSVPFTGNLCGRHAEQMARGARAYLERTQPGRFA